MRGGARRGPGRRRDGRCRVGSLRRASGPQSHRSEHRSVGRGHPCDHPRGDRHGAQRRAHHDHPGAEDRTGNARDHPGALGWRTKKRRGRRRERYRLQPVGGGQHPGDHLQDRHSRPRYVPPGPVLADACRRSVLVTDSAEDRPAQRRGATRAPGAHGGRIVHTCRHDPRGDRHACSPGRLRQHRGTTTPATRWPPSGERSRCRYRFPTGASRSSCCCWWPPSRSRFGGW